MVEVIAHRGLWKTLGEQNTLTAFEKALEKGFGIEVDVRDDAGNLVISHNPPIGIYPNGLLEFTELISLVGLNCVAINIKSCGLAPLFRELEPPKNWFFFDMSISDTWEYRAVGLPYYVRYCPPEEPSVGGKLWDNAKGFYMDNIEKGSLQLITLPSKRTVVVSPELHQREYLPLWGSWKRSKISNFSIVTDNPEECREFFK